MEHWSTVTVAKSIQYLLENSFCTLFIQPLSTLDVLKEISAARVFHNHQKVLLTLKDLKQTNDARMPYLFKNVNLLEDFAARVVVLNVSLINWLDGHVLACQFVNPKSNLTKRPLTEQLDEFVKLEGGVWDWAMLFNMGFDVPNQLFAFLGHSIVQHHLRLFLLAGGWSSGDLLHGIFSVEVYRLGVDWVAGLWLLRH